MHKPLRTLLLASLLSLPGALFARTVTPFAQPAQQKNAFASWTPNQLPQTTDIDIAIYLPSEGTHDWWSLSFESLDGGANAYFETNSSMATSNYLGSLPAGRYNLSYYTICGPDAAFDVRMDFYDGTRNGNRWTLGNYGTVYNVTVGEQSNVLIIDKY